MSGIALRAAGAADCDTLALLIGELLAEHDTAPPADFAATLRRDGFGEAPRFEALLAEREGEPVGVALVYPVYRPSLGACGLLMEDLYVRSAARRFGVGRMLLSRVATLARERGCKYILWEVEDANDAAQAFYARCGARLRDNKRGYELDAAAIDALAG